MAETVRVAGVTVTQQALEQIFDALRAHHWLAIPPQYRPSIGRFRPATKPTATLDEVVHELMADGTLMRQQWFRDMFDRRGKALF